MRQILLITLVLVLPQCSNRSGKESISFQAFIKQLKKVETPISFNSNETYTFAKRPLKDSVFFKLIQKKYEGFSVFGLLFKSSNFSAILGNLPTDTGSPFILTFNKNGDIVDSHLLFENVIGDMGIYTSNYVTIYSNREIVLIDSTIRRKINAEGSDEIPGTDSLTVKTKNYIIDNNGKISMNK